MMQSSYECVKNAIEFTGPERVPYNFDENRTPEIDTKYGDDFIWVFVDSDPNFIPSQPGENELGVVSETLDEKVFGLPKIAPLDDWAKLASYRFPNYADPIRYKRLERRIAENPGKYVLGMFPHFLFQEMMHLVGFEKMMTDVIAERDNIEELNSRMVDSCITVVHCMADRGVHGIIAIEDLGLQDRLIVSPRIWRQIFKPGFARIIEVAHQRGLHIFSHTCGYILDIIEDMIEIGLDGIQLDQQDHMGIDELAKRYGGRICFFCPVDIQTTLCMPGETSAIEAHAKHLIRAFGSYNGGFIAKTYPQPEAIRIPEENNALMCAVFKQYGRYPLDWVE